MFDEDRSQSGLDYLTLREQIGLFLYYIEEPIRPYKIREGIGYDWQSNVNKKLRQMLSYGDLEQIKISHKNTRYCLSEQGRRWVEKELL